MTGLTPEGVEELLGDPYDPANPYGFAAAVARDEADAYPDELCAALVGAGFHLNYLPRAWGGALEAFDRSMTLVRAAARRDVNVMPGTMFSIIAATCLQLHGSEGQKKKVADILVGGGAVAYALTEAAHGSDLLTNEVRVEGGRLYGEKWLVGNGLRADAVYVLARTGPRGPGAFSAYLLDADAPGLVRTPAPFGNGMRGVELARLRFDGVPLPEEALVGKAGEGLEVTVLAQQAVRLMSMAGSLGCADSALRLTLDFAAGRRVGGLPLAETPYARRDLAVASAAVFAADGVALAAARGVHVAPAAFSVWALAAKHVVAEATEDVVRRCAAVLATRAVLRDGVFQKIQRDVSVVRVIDASPLANLRAFAGQIPALVAHEGDGGPDERIFDLGAGLPPYDPTRLDLVVRGADPVLTQLPAIDDPLVRELADAVAGLTAEAVEVRRPTADPNALVDLAERYAWLHAGAVCVRLWSANPELGNQLRAALAYLLARADGTDPRRRAADLLPALDAAHRLHAGGLLFSAVPVRLSPKESR